MGRKNNTINILQFDSHLVSLMRVRRSDKGLDLIEYTREVPDTGGAEGLQGAVTRFVQRHGLAGEPVAIILPRHEMTARTLVLPSHDLDEINGMVRLGAEEYVPYPIEDLVIDQCVLRRLTDGHARVLAVYALRDTVEGYVDVVRNAGADPQSVYMSTTCLASAAMATHPVETEPYAIAHLSTGGLELLVIRGRLLEYSRGVASHRAGELESIETDQLIEELALELRASLAAYRRDSEEGTSVGRVYVSSDWRPVGDLCESLSAETGYPCEPANFARAAVLRGADRLELLPLTAIGAGLAEQGRAALSVNLVPESVLAARARAERKRKTVRAAAGIAVVLLAVAALYGQAVYMRKAYLAELERRVEEARPEAEGVIEKSRHLALLQQQIDPVGSALEVLARISEAAPESGITITRVSYERGQRVTVQGRAKTAEDLARFTEGLREKGGPMFAQARRGNEVRVTEPGGVEVWEYVFEIPFPEDAELPVDEGADDE